MSYIIGISGVTDARVIEKISFLRPEDQEIYIGVLTTSKLLNAVTEPKGRYVCLKKIRELAEVSQILTGISCIVHYCMTDHKHDDKLMITYADRIFQAGSAGMQFNSPRWPHVRGIELIKEHHPGKKIILQVNELLIKGYKGDINKVAEKVASYGANIDYALIDQSSGTGKEFGSRTTLKLIKAIREASSVPIGLAGGLGPENAKRVRSFINNHGIALIDAEKKLMNAKSNIAISKAAAYIEKYI